MCWFPVCYDLLLQLCMRQLYTPQTKMLEGRTNISECVFEALFIVLLPKYSTHTLEKCFEYAL